MFNVVVEDGSITGIIFSSKTLDDPRLHPVSEDKINQIKIGEPVSRYHKDFTRMTDEDVLQQEGRIDSRGWWHTLEQENETASVANNPQEVYLSLDETPPPGWQSGRHPDILAQERKEKLKTMARVAKNRMEQSKAKKIVARQPVPISIERGIAAATLQEADGLTLKDRQQ